MSDIKIYRLDWFSVPEGNKRGGIGNQSWR